ncbi:ABC transporter permease [Streptomyces sp. NPDC059564]|uniref:ABC transporter permease n=1 Tax=Streptomyces sp. NPDC059564 TaxID=3346865 RepID=UPI0036A9CB9B
MSSALTQDTPRKGVASAPARRLRGLAWLMVRQHRTALLVCAAAVVLGTVWIVYERGAMLDTLHGAGWPAKSPAELDGSVANRVTNDLNSGGSSVAFLSLLLGVFLGAPLISADQESGVARLVTTQSVSRTRWLAWKLCFALVLASVTTGILGLVYAWWWRSAGPFAPSDWLSNPVFEVTGPVGVATALFTTSLGILAGALLRRTVVAMVCTFLVSGVALVAAEEFRTHLATPRRLTYPLGESQPALLDHVVQVDNWIGTASGKLYGWGTCVNDSAPESCRSGLGIVNSVWDYYGEDQMAGMQWAAAAVLLALAAVCVAALMWRARRRPL